MVDLALMAKPAFSLPIGRHGKEDGAAGLHLRNVTGRALISVLARKGQIDALKSAARAQFGCELPDQPVAKSGPKVSFVWCGHHQWLAMADEKDVPDLMAALREAFGNAASLSDQSDGRAVVEVAGPDARKTIAKLAPLDLHPRAFKPSQTALTLFGHIGGQITQTSESPAYEVTVFRGFAENFWHDLAAAGAEYGIDVTAG